MQHHRHCHFRQGSLVHSRAHLSYIFHSQAPLWNSLWQDSVLIAKKWNTIYKHTAQFLKKPTLLRTNLIAFQMFCNLFLLEKLLVQFRVSLPAMP